MLFVVLMMVSASTVFNHAGKALASHISAPLTEVATQMEHIAYMELHALAPQSKRPGGSSGVAVVQFNPRADELRTWGGFQRTAQAAVPRL